MKRHLLLLIGSVLLTFMSSAQNFVWAKTYGGTGSDVINRIATDPSGNVIVAGNFNFTVDFDPNAGTTNLTSVSTADFYMAKYSPSGNLIWVKQVAGAAGSYNSPKGIVCDAAGNIYFTGSYYGTADFNPGAGVANLTATGTTNSDIFVCKWDANGNYIWAKSMGGAGNDWSNDIDIDNSGAVYIIGDFNGTGDFDPGAGVANPTVYGLRDIFISKLDANGNYVWVQSMGSSADYEDGYSIRVNSTLGIVYSTGAFYTTADLSPGVAAPNYTAFGQNDIFVSKISSNTGIHIAAKIISGAGTEISTSIEIDASNNVYLTGRTEGSTDFDTDGGTFILSTTGIGDFDGYVCKLDANLSLVWAKQFIEPGSASNGGGDIILDSYQNITVSGGFADVTDFDPSPSTTYTVANVAAPNGSDFFVVKLDPSGNFKWVRTWGNSSTVAGHIALDASNNIYTGGYFYSSTDVCDFDPGVGTFTLSSTGSSANCYIQKLSCTLPETVTASPNVYSICNGSNANIPFSISSPIETGTTYNWSVVGASGVSFSPITGTNTVMSLIGTSNCSVVVTASNVCGTSTTNVSEITINPNPTVTAVASPSTVCHNGYATLTGSGAASYVWTPYIQNGVATVFHNWGSTPIVLNYNVKGTDSNGCVDSTVVALTVTPTPTITVTGKGLACKGTSNILTANGGLTYTWTPGSIISPTLNAQPLTPTVYSISAYDSNGCYGDTTFAVSFPISPAPSICEVTVDSAGVYNEIYWEKSLYPQADSFIVYRETSSGNYTRIGATSKNALCMYVDTNRSIGPNNGNPNYTSYKYKLALIDTCGTLSAQSLWHQTLFMQDQLNGNFNWNSYAIEGTTATPVSNYTLIRRDLATGTETVVGSTSANLFTDPQYASVWTSNIKWYVQALGFNCDPTLRLSSPLGTLAQKVKTKSNHANEKTFPTKINDVNAAIVGNLKVYPNPAKDRVTVELGIANQNVSIELNDVLGQTLTSINTTEVVTILNTSNFKSGVYFLNIKCESKTIAVRKIIVE